MIRKTCLLMLLVYAILILPLGAVEPFATITSGTPQSLDWQKINLQDTIRKRYESVISKVITSAKYIVNVKIEFSPPAKQGKEKSNDDFKNVKKVKFNNNLSTQTSGDSIIFSKLGLEAPLLADEDNYKRESLKKTIRDISSSFDIFNHLQSVSIEVFLNDKLEIKTRKVVEDLILGIQALSSQKIKPRVVIKYISMDENLVKTPQVEPTLMEKLGEWAPKYANAIGLLLSVLALGIVCSLLFNKYFDLQEKHLEQMKSQSQKIENKNDNKDKDLDGKNGGKTSDQITDEESIKSFERFRSFLNQSPIESQLLIKKWISKDEDIYKLALNSLVKQLTNEELQTIFEVLTADERKMWKKSLKVDLSEEEIKIGNAFISSQVVEDIIAPPLIKDPTMIKIISSLTPKQGADIAMTNPSIGTVLLNIMPPKFTAEMLEKLDMDSMTSLIKNSAVITEEDLFSGIASFKENLPHVQKALARSPFVENILNHIAFASPQTEKSLFRLLASFESEEVVFQEVLANLPAEIVNKVPVKIVKAALQNLSQTMRIQYFYVQEESQQLSLLNLFAAEGTKSRELISFEFEKIANDQAAHEEVMKNRLNLEKSYHLSVRKLVRNNPEFAKDVRAITLEWIAQLNDVTEAEGPVAFEIQEGIETQNEDSNDIKDVA